jgi:hypothetical protein
VLVYVHVSARVVVSGVVYSLCIHIHIYSYRTKNNRDCLDHFHSRLISEKRIYTCVNKRKNPVYAVPVMGVTGRPVSGWLGARLIHKYTAAASLAALP